MAEWFVTESCVDIVNGDSHNPTWWHKRDEDGNLLGKFASPPAQRLYPWWAGEMTGYSPDKVAAMKAVDDALFFQEHWKEVVHGERIKASDIPGYKYGTCFDECIIETDVPAINGYRYTHSIFLKGNDECLLLIPAGRVDICADGNLFWNNGDLPTMDELNEPYDRVWRNVMGE